MKELTLVGAASARARAEFLRAILCIEENWNMGRGMSRKVFSEYFGVIRNFQAESKLHVVVLTSQQPTTFNGVHGALV